MKKRFQITVGPETQKLVKAIAARLRKETASDWTFVEVLESAASGGLLNMAQRHKLPVEPLQHIRK